MGLVVRGPIEYSREVVFRAIVNHQAMGRAPWYGSDKSVATLVRGLLARRAESWKSGRVVTG